MQDIGSDAITRDDACLYAQAIADTMQEALVVLDEQLRLVFANRVFYRMFRLSEADMKARCLYDLGGPAMAHSPGPGNT